MKLCKSKKKNIWIFLLAVLLILIPNQVRAAQMTICSDGDYYLIDNYNSINEVDFYKNDLNLFPVFTSSGATEPNWNRASLNGTEFRYVSIGKDPSNSSPKNSIKCYVVESTNADSKTYTSKTCGGESYRVDDIIFETKTTNPENYENQTIDKNTGKITLIIKPVKGKKIQNQWSRLRVSSIVYQGEVIYEENGVKKVNITVNNTVGNESITITNISPAKVDIDASFNIQFYLNGITESDFSENVSATEKQKYMDSCGGANEGIYLGTLPTTIISENEVMVTNPIKNSNICQEVKNFTTASEDIRKGFINECYDSEVPYYQLGDLNSIVTQKLNTLRNIYSGNKNVKNLVNEKNLLCTDSRMGIPSSYAPAEPFETKIVYEDIGEFFGEVCVETYYVDGGWPSLVRPGEGVDYQNFVEVKKTCSIFQVSTVSKPPKCNNSVSRSCLHNNVSNGPQTLENGGPNADFDSCITECDGGTYTQSCINKCYHQAYSSSNRKVNSLGNHNLYSFYSNNLGYNNRLQYTSNLKQINSGSSSISPFTYTFSFAGYGTHTYPDANGYYVVCDSRWFSDHRPPTQIYDGYGSCHLYAPDGTEIATMGYAPSCDNTDLGEAQTNGAKQITCSFTLTTYPVGCSNDPEAALQAQISRAKQELQKYEAIANEESELKDYRWEIIDSETGFVYALSGSSTDSGSTGEPRLIIQKDVEKSKAIKSNVENKTNFNIGEGNIVNGIVSKTISTIYTVDFPITYSRVGDAQVIAIKDNSTNQYYTYNESDTTARDGRNYYNFNSLSFDSSFYSPGRQKYYTNIDSGNYNVSINDPRFDESMLSKIPNAKLTVGDNTYIYVLVDLNNNIKVNLTVGGITENDQSDFQEAEFYCYYGVYAAGLKDTDDDDSCDIGDPDCPQPIPPGEDPTPPDDDDECVPGENGCPYPWDNGSSYDYLGKDPFGSEKGNGSLGLRYYYREIKLTDVFPNDRRPRWNWTGTILANGTTTGAANNSDPSYIVDPTKLIEAIEAKGESIWTSYDEDDYTFTLTPNLITDIRRYNRSRVDGRRISYLYYSLAGNSLKNTYSKKIREWLPQLDTTSITECNNSKGNNCDNTLGGY